MVEPLSVRYASFNLLAPSLVNTISPKPKVWTENRTGWFTGFGGPVPHRPAKDVAFSVARFIHKGGSYMNYYMTNFGRTAGTFIATSYDYDAPIDEY
ncbi:hypothetical protein IFM89_009358, partial [Coptis chinensis]